MFNFHNKLWRFLPAILIDTLSVIISFVLVFFCVNSNGFCVSLESSSAEIEWKLFLNNNSIITTTTPSGEAFIIKDADINGNISSSQDLMESLEGTEFILNSSPVSGSLSIHIILNVQGNSFDPVEGIDLFINLEIEAYVNGDKDDTPGFFQSLVMTIPVNGIDYLMSLCKSTDRRDIVFVYYDGMNFEDEGIETHQFSNRMVVNIKKLSTIIGGKNSDFGIPASTNYSTWYKIKKLFE